MKHEVVPHPDDPESSFIVRAVNTDGDCEIFVTTFEGADARQRADEYAAWKNGPVKS
jgi:hypothetical protein